MLNRDGTREPVAAVVRTVGPGDRQAALGLLAEARPTVGGLAGPAVEAALYREGLRGDGLAFVVAEEEARQGPVGLALAAIHPARYWGGFLRRHPILAARIALGRLGGRLARQERTSVAVTVPSEKPAAVPTWGDSGPEVARVVIIGVAESSRGRGLAGLLYDGLARTLASRGVRRLHARIDAENGPSLALHRRHGWHLEPAGEGFFAWLELTPAAAGT